jgi:hypothetical protein
MADYVLLSSAEGGVVCYGDSENLPLTDGDRSLHARVNLGTLEEVDVMWRSGRLRIAIIDVGTDDYRFAAIKSFSGGSITAIGTTSLAVDTTYSVFATWDRDTATVAVIVDGTEEATEEDAANYVNTPNLPTYSASLPGSSWCTELAVWDRVVEAAPAGSPPLGNLVGWYDAADTSTLTITSSPDVDEWADKSSADVDLFDVTVPFHTGATINGRNALTLGALTGEYMESTATFDPTSGAQGLTLAAVVRPSSTGAQGIINVCRAASSDLLGLSMEIGASARLQVSYGDGSSGAHATSEFNALRTATSAFSVNELFLVVITCNTSSVALRKNGSAQSITTFAGTLAIGNFLSNLGAGTFKVRVGDRSGSGLSGNEFAGEFAEAVVYDAALSGTDLTDLETYLATKWGITI